MTDVPLGVKIIAVLYWISAAFMGLAAVLVLFMGSAFAALLGNMLGVAGAGLMAGVAVALLGLVVLYVFIGRGLWKAQPWARIVAIVLSVIGLLGGVGNLALGSWMGGTINIVISGVVGGYLLFSSEVKDAF